MEAWRLNDRKSLKVMSAIVPDLSYGEFEHVGFSG